MTEDKERRTEKLSMLFILIVTFIISIIQQKSSTTAIQNPLFYFLKLEHICAVLIRCSSGS